MEGDIQPKAGTENAPRKLWMYWETPQGKTIPPYIALSSMAIRHNCRDIDLQIVTPQDLPHLLPDLHHNIHKVTTNPDTLTPTLAVKTGFIRTLLLAKYGGLYTDIDSLPMGTLAPFFDAIDDHGFIAVRRTSAPKRHISIGLLGARVGNPIVTAYAQELSDVLADRFLFSWGEIGAWCLTPIVEKYPDACLIVPEEYAHPIVAERQHLFMSKTLEPADVLTEKALTVMLFHRPFSGPSKAVPELGLEAAPLGWLHDWSIEDLYTGDILLSKLFRKSLPEDAFIKYADEMKLAVQGVNIGF